MALLCELCQTVNRDGAKFCKGCGRKIAQSWPGGAEEAQTAARSLAPSEPPSAPESVPLRHAVRGHRRRLLIPAAGAALFVAAVALFAISHRSEVVSEASQVSLVSMPTMSSAPIQPAVQAASAAAVQFAIPAQAASAETPTSEAASPVANAASQVPDVSSEARPKPSRKPPARKPAPAPPVVQVSPPPMVVPAPPAIPTPQEACAGLNFVAKARCLATQCARPEQKTHPQCQAVREQQRLEEEKRNPQLAN